MIMIPFPLLFLILLPFIYRVHAVEGGEGTYPMAAVEGAQIIDNSTHIPVRSNRMILFALMTHSSFTSSRLAFILLGMWKPTNIFNS